MCLFVYLGAFAAQRFVVHHGECRVGHRVGAFGASEAITVPLSVEGDDSLVDDGLGAAGAARRELVSVASRAVGAAGLFHEAASPELLPADSADEVVRVPRHAQSLDHAVCDRVSAAVAARAVVLREA